MMNLERYKNIVIFELISNVSSNILNFSLRILYNSIDNRKIKNDLFFIVI